MTSVGQKTNRLIALSSTTQAECPEQQQETVKDVEDSEDEVVVGVERGATIMVNSYIRILTSQSHTIVITAISHLQ